MDASDGSTPPRSSVMRAVDRGLPIDAARVGDRMTSALAGGALGIRRAESGISIEGGQARLLSNPVLATPSVDLAVNAHINLAEGVLDTRLTLSAMPSTPAKTWPEVVVTLKDRSIPEAHDRCLRVHELAGFCVRSSSSRRSSTYWRAARPQAAPPPPIRPGRVAR